MIGTCGESSTINHRTARLAVFSEDLNVDRLNSLLFSNTKPAEPVLLSLQQTKKNAARQ